MANSTSDCRHSSDRNLRREMTDLPPPPASWPPAKPMGVLVPPRQVTSQVKPRRPRSHPYGRPDARHRARNVGGHRCGTLRKFCSVALLSSRRFSHNLAQPQTALPKPRVAQIVGGRVRPGEPHAGRPATPIIIEATGCLTWGPPHRAQPIQAGLQAGGEFANAPSAISKVQQSESPAKNVTIELAAIVAVECNVC